MKLSFLLRFFLMGLALQIASAQTNYPPAPFVLTPSSIYPNPILYRMDHVGGCPGNGVEMDEQLELHWQLSRWQPPFESRNDTTDTVRYELNVIIDSVGAASSKTITVSFPAGLPGQPWYPGVNLSGDQIYGKIFRPPVPWPMEPDTIVMRVNWYVRAYNRYGSTYSDTAGVTIRDSTYIPTCPLVLSYNRPPYNPPVPFMPVNNAIVTGISAKTKNLDVVWTQPRDRNMDVGQVLGAFHVFVPGTGWKTGWIIDQNYWHTVDTLAYMWVGTVVHTAPAGKGAPIGTVLVRNTGKYQGHQLQPDQLSQLFGGFSNDSGSTSADSVLIEWRVYVKDFNYYGGASMAPMEEVTFRYKDDGTLQADTAKWSRFGCRPHELVSSTYRFTLVKDRTSDIPRYGSGAPSDFTLSQNYPNPFKSSTAFDYTIPTAASVRIVVYDILGSPVRTLVNGRMDAGTHVTKWDGASEFGQILPPGIYHCRMLVNGRMQSTVMALLK